MFDNMVLCQSPAYYKDLQVGEGAKKSQQSSQYKKKRAQLGIDLMR